MRYQKIDILRAIAVIAMVLFHFQYTLFHVFGLQFFHPHIVWEFIGKSSAIIFMGLGGVSFSLAESKYNHTLFLKYIRTSFQIAFLALVVSLGSFFFVHKMYIIFGILHYFSLSFLLLLFFRKLKYWNILIALCILYLPQVFSFESDTLSYFILGFTPSDFRSLDYYPLIPYFGYMLLGYALGIFFQAQNYMRFFSLEKESLLAQILIYIGKHSLAIYVIHLPFLFLLPFAILYIFGL